MVVYGLYHDNIKIWKSLHFLLIKPYMQKPSKHIKDIYFKHIKSIRATKKIKRT